MPMLVKRSSTATASRASGATISATRWSAENTIGSMVKWKVSGKWIWLVVGRLPQISGMKHGTQRQQLGQAEGGHGQDQPRRAEEAPDDGQLDEGARARSAPTRPTRQRQEVVPPGVDHQAHGQHGGGGAQLALGEVEDAVGPVDEGHAHRDHGAEQAEDEPLDGHPGRHREHREAEHRDDHRGREHRESRR